MVPIHFKPSRLKGVRPGQYLTRFLFGCAVTLLAAVIGKWRGAVLGGIFLAFPGIFPPSVSFVETEHKQRMQNAGVYDDLQPRAVASIHAAGASAGTFGLITFALVVWLGLNRLGSVWTLLVATLAWFAVSFTAWWIREKI